MRLAWVGVAAVALAGCQREAQAGAPDPSANPTPTPTRTAIATVPLAKVRHALVDAEGLAIGRNPGTAIYFPFGTPRASVDAAGDKWLAKAEQSALDECGAGPMEFSQFGQLKLNYLDGKLVGWFLEEGPGVTTSDGKKPGELMRDLAVSRSVRYLRGSTLEGEFEYQAADGHMIGGFASGAGKDAKIRSLHAGINCFFR